MSTILITGGTIITSGGEKQADVLIENGIIISVTKNQKPITNNVTVIDASGLLLFPGLIDCHVHFREPGLEHKETLATGSASAIAGGVTTVCEMPNTVPPTVTVEALRDKVRRAKACHPEEAPQRRLEGDMRPTCDIRFFFGATELQHLAELQKLFTDPTLKELRTRCCGLKLFFDHSTGNQAASLEVIEKAFKLCAELDIQIVGHCEDANMNNELRSMNRDTDVSAHSKIRPPESEAITVEYALTLAEKYGTRFHVAHLSTKQGIDLVRAAKKSGLAVTCEVTPHHLFLTVDDYATLGTLAKMNPPLRTKDHQDALWAGIADGTVDCVSTDHAPHTLEEKGVTLRRDAERPVSKGDPLQAPSGVPGVETMLPLLLGKLPPQKILQLCFRNPNRIFRLGKQGITEGALANIALVDPKKTWLIEGKKLHSKCGWTPFEGKKITGSVVRVIQ